ncbi:substrate-binding domain-containing protein [Asticcacaulis solisilvae]|uniref:substrate-binding domain-containing protein n=1 Tax=Asticcacaulis solisilvae TaxID=1217274 RepID=UPI003FD8EB26
MKKSALFAPIVGIALLSVCAAGQAVAKTKVFVSMAKSGDRFIDILRDSVIKSAADDPDLDVTMHDAHNDGPTQISQLKEAIAEHADAFVVLSVDGKTGVQMGELAAKGNIPIIFLNRRPPADKFDGQASIVLSNDLVAGRLQMRLIADKLNGTGNVVILRGEEGHPAAIDRTQGVKEILAKRPGIHLVEEATGSWKREEGERLVTQWLSSGQKIDAILANNDEMAMGAINALKKANIPAGKILVAGVDGTPDALEAIKSGYLTLSFLQNARAQAAQALVDAKKVANKQYAEFYDWVPYELIIPTNVDSYMQPAAQTASK